MKRLLSDNPRHGAALGVDCHTPGIDLPGAAYEIHVQVAVVVHVLHREADLIDMPLQPDQRTIIRTVQSPHIAVDIGLWLQIEATGVPRDNALSGLLAPAHTGSGEQLEQEVQAALGELVLGGIHGGRSLHPTREAELSAFFERGG